MLRRVFAVADPTMEASLDLSRWAEKPRGVGYRRWTMISTGLRQLFRLRLFRILIFLAWGGGMMLAALGFLFSQSVASGGWLETSAVYLGPRAQALSSALAGLILMYPEICIGGWFSLIFWLHSYLGLGLSLVALTAMIPRLITRDRATNALIVYLSRPLTSSDYLLGKLGMIVGVLGVMWTGPLLFGWMLSVGFAPDTDFIYYSFQPLLRALLFHAIGLVTLAAIALGVSAVSQTSRNTTVLWIGLWLIVGAVAKPPGAPLWLKRASFAESLGEVRQGILRVDTAFSTAAETLPLLDQRFVRNLGTAGKNAASTDFHGALTSLGIFVVLSSFVFLRRLRPE
jgi:ABC-2 type transport system permease protein